MKLRVALALLLSFLALPAFAADPVSFGVEAGVNMNKANFSGSDVGSTKTKYKAGIIAGLFASIPVAPKIAIVPEVVYAQKDTKVEDTGFTATLATAFVEVPVLVKISPMGSEGFYIVVGPAISFNTTAKFKDQKAGTQTFPDEDLKAEKTIETTDFGVIGGAGFSVGKISIEARYDAGLKNLNKDTDKDVFKVKNRTISLLLKLALK